MKRSRQAPTCFLTVPPTGQRIRPHAFFRHNHQLWFPPSKLLDKTPLSGKIFTSSHLQATSTPLWGRLSTSLEASLGLAFLLGGLFFAKLLPRFLAIAALCWQRLTKSKKSSITRKPRRTFRRQSSVTFKSVGRPGLVVIQHVAEKLAGRSFQTQMKRALQEGISQISNPNIRSIEIETFETNPTPNKTPPIFKRGRIYDSEDSMVFDVDIQWDNCLDAGLKITTKRLGLEIPVRIHNFMLQGSLRFILTPLIMEPPGFGACLISFPTMPCIDADLTVAGGQITKVKWLKEELMDALGDILEQEMVWPNRIVNPSLQENKNATKITREEIRDLQTSDPFLQLEKNSINQRQQKRNKRSQNEEAKKGRLPWDRLPNRVPQWQFVSSLTNRGNEMIQEAIKRLPFKETRKGKAADTVEKPSEVEEENGEASYKRNATTVERKSSEQEEKLWDKLLDRVVQPLELSETIINDTASDSSNATKIDNLPDLKKVTQKMSEVGSLDEFIALFEN